MEFDLAEMKERSRAAWALGDYRQLARLIEPAARELVAACGVDAGDEVLDVAAGNGNLALEAARIGARVTACDLSPAMVELGRERSRREGLDVDWVEADAEAMPFEDGRFDCVASVFGAMLTPSPPDAARELFRVARSGGTVGMANWTPNGFMGQMFALGRELDPSADQVPPNTEWGRPEVVEERFSGLAADVTFERRAVPYRFESAAALVDFLEHNAGPMVAARRALPEDVKADLRRRTIDLAERYDAGGSGSLAIDAEYLLVTARKP